MVATIEICESNTVSETITHGITNSNMGDTDAANMMAASYPITPGNRNYIKYQRFHVTAMGGSSKVKSFKVWRTTALPGSDTHVTNARESAYAGALTYATPVKTAVTNVNQPEGYRRRRAIALNFTFWCVFKCFPLPALSQILGEGWVGEVPCN